MQIGMIEGATRYLGKAQGYIGLPIRDGVVNSTVTGEGTPTMTSAWFPTLEELQALLHGAAIYVEIVGNSHPPIMVRVGEANK